MLVLTDNAHSTHEVPLELGWKGTRVNGMEVWAHVSRCRKRAVPTSARAQWKMLPTVSPPARWPVEEVKNLSTAGASYLTERRLNQWARSRNASPVLASASMTRIHLSQSSAYTGGNSTSAVATAASGTLTLSGISAGRVPATGVDCSCTSRKPRRCSASTTPGRCAMACSTLRRAAGCGGSGII